MTGKGKTEELTIPGLLVRYVDALIDVSCGRRSDPVRLTVENLPQRGLFWILQVGERSFVHALVAQAQTPEHETRTYVLDESAAWVEFWRIIWHLNPEMAAELSDHCATLIQPDALKGIAQPGDVAWLIAWTRYRAGCPRMDFDEAARLFGSTPSIDLSGAGPVITWPELAGLAGDDSEFERRRQLCEGIAAAELNEVLEKFCGSMSASFCEVWLKPLREKQIPKEDK